MRPADTVPLTTRVLMKEVRYRTVLAPSAASVSQSWLTGSHFVPSVRGLFVSYDLNGAWFWDCARCLLSTCTVNGCGPVVCMGLALGQPCSKGSICLPGDCLHLWASEVLDAPEWDIVTLSIKSNETITLSAGANNPSRAASRRFQYSVDNSTWCDAACACVCARAHAHLRPRVLDVGLQPAVVSVLDG
jgi:hypothetical protein